MKPAALALLALLVAPGCSASADVPERSEEVERAAMQLPERSEQPVFDQADILQPQTEASLDARLRKLFLDTGDALVVVSVDSLQNRSIESYATALGNEWRIGSPGGRGVLVLVAPAERKVRIEVDCAAESTVTDAVAAEIIDERMLPRFRDGDLAGGTMAGVDALVEQLALPRPANDPGPHTPGCLARAKEAA